jgi:FkbM family methyltransferase
MSARTHWLESLLAQITFELSAPPRTRDDPYFDWGWLRARKRLAAEGAGPGDPYSAEWLREHADALWETRQRLADDASKMLLDAYLVLRAVGPYRFRFPRVDFEPWLTVHAKEPFNSPGLPADYTGQPLFVFELSVDGAQGRIRVIATELQVNLCNAFRQYAPIRDGNMLGPRPADVVLDCGACIGEFSMLFAAMTGATGAVHLFDPVPLHLRFCALQAALNPALGHVLHPVHAAVGAVSGRAAGDIADLAHIAPGGLKVDTYDTITLDGYAQQAALTRIDFVKMDIEGAELEALAGASHIISTRRPRLAVSAYHSPSHMWEIPRAMQLLNPRYRLHFGHHTPVRWEAVFYAVDNG